MIVGSVCDLWFVVALALVESPVLVCLWLVLGAARAWVHVPCCVAGGLCE